MSTRIMLTLTGLVVVKGLFRLIISMLCTNKNEIVRTHYTKDKLYYIY